MQVSFTTYPVKCWDLESGDTYLIGTVGGKRETRTVLSVIQRTPMNGALVECVDPRGDVFRSHMSGSLDVIQSDLLEVEEQS